MKVLRLNGKPVGFIHSRPEAKLILAKYGDELHAARTMPALVELFRRIAEREGLTFMERRV